MSRFSFLLILVVLAQVIFPPAVAAGTCDPDIYVTPTTVDFGSIPVGTISLPETITVTNEGNADLEIIDIVIIGVDASEFFIASVNTTSPIIPPGGSASGTVKFAPVSIGSKSAHLIIYSNDPCEGCVDVKLKGAACEAPPDEPDISVNPTDIDFGDVEVGSPSSPRNVTVTNDGDADLIIGNLTINDSQFSISSGNISGQTLVPGASENITLIFTPSATGGQSANLIIPSNDPDESEVTVSLCGTGIFTPPVEPDISVSPTEINFGSVPSGSSSSPRIITISNVGTANLFIQDIGTGSSQFVIISDNATGQSLAPDTSANISVIFSPTSTGFKESLLGILSDDPDENLTTVYIYGTGTPSLVQDIAVTPVLIDFGQVPVGSSSSDEIVTITNEGTAALTIGTLSILGVNPGQYTIISDNASGQVLSPGVSANVSLRFVPTTTGHKIAELNIPSDDPDEDPVTVALDGNRPPPPPLEPDIDVSPPTVDFGAVLIGASSGSENVTVTNNGTLNLIIGNLTINDDQFSISSGNISGQTLVPGASENITLIFTPTAAGGQSANITMPSNDPDENPFNVPLSGTGIEPDILIEPATVNFGPVPVGSSSSPETVTVTNIGNAPLQLGTFHTAGAGFDQFNISNDNASGTTLAPGENATLQVTFNPSSAGSKTAGLEVSSNDPDEPTASITLTGTGIVPNINVTPLDLNLGSVPVNSSSAPGVITVSNTGEAPLDVGTIQIIGADAGYFSIESDNVSNQSLATGVSANISVRFNPTVAGVVGAQLYIPSNDPNEPSAYVTIHGTGIEPDIDVNPTTIDFGSIEVGLSSVSSVVNVTNNGTDNLMIGTITIVGANPLDFNIVSDNASSQTLSPGASANVSVRFNPTTAGIKGAELQIPSNDPDDNPAFVTLSGTGVISPDTNSVSFETYPGSTGSITFDGTVYYDMDNTSVVDGTYNIVANVPAGFTFSHWRYSGGVSVANPSAAATTCSVSDNGWLEMVLSPADGPDTNSVSFYTLPWYTGSISFDGTVYYDMDNTSVADGTYNIVANVPAGFTFSQWRYSGGVSVANPSAAATTCSVSDNGWLEMVLSPADGPDTNSVSFYTVPWYTGSITFDGTTYYDTDFTSVADGTYNIVANVPAGFTFSQWRYSGGVSVANPSAAATTCSVSDNGWLEMVLSPADGPDITVTPMSLDFGLVEVGSSSSTENVTVTNEGAANLIIGNLSINNNQFSVTSGNISDQTLIPGASANITVGFTPGSTGAHSANLTIPSNDADENPVNVLLSGNGTEPPTTEADLEITKTDSPDPVAFGDNLTYTLTVINHGPSNATSVNVTDVLYPYLVYVSSNTSAGSVNATTDFPYWSVNWDIGNLASGDNVTLDIVATINPLLPIFGIFTTMDTISNIATVTGNEDDPNIDNNTASEDTGLLTTDLEITKTDKEDPVMFGDNITWYITVTNNGPLDATDVVALDLYTPGFITIKATEPSTGTVSQTPPQWLDDVFQQFGANITSISGGLSVLYWDIGDLASGASANLTIIASDNLTSLAPANTTWALSPAVAGFLSVISGSGFQPPEFPYPNLAGVLSTTLDSDASNNMVVETTTLSLNLPETDLEITKTDDPDPVASDGSVTYTVNIKNNGPEDAPNVYVFDTWLASSLILQSVTPSVGTTNQTIPQWLLDVFSPGGGTPTIGDNYLWWEVGPLPSGASANLTIVAIVNVTLAMQTPYIYNAAMVFGDVRDIDPSNNIIMVDTSIGVADLEISKTDSPDPVAFGDNLTYTLTVTNNSPVTAAGASVIDNLPDGTTFLSANPSTGTYTHSSGNVTWDIGDITAGNTVNMTIVVTAPSSPGDITNTATVSGSYFDPVMGNNIASANTTPVPPNSADLVITKTDSPDPVATGGNLTYTVTVTNNGPADMGSFTVSDDLPDSVLFQSANASIGTAYESTGIVYWNIDSLNSGSSVNMTITVTAPLETGIIINYAEILGEYAEAIPGNESVSENTTVALPTDADLEITKTGSPDPVYALEDLTYVLTVTNNGPADATSVNVTDTLPPGVTYKSSVPTGNFNSANGTVSWNLGNLAAGANTTLTIIASAPGVSGDITNTAVVSGAEQDPVPGNNEATATTKVDKPIIIWLIDLAIEKTDSQDPVLTGDNLTYTLTVTNKGLIDTVGVTVTDNLPPEATYQTHNTVTGTASHTSGNVTWNIGSLATGDSANLTITVTAPTEEAVLRNVASVTGTADIDGGSDDIVIEINPFDNTAIEFTTVLTSINTPDITVTPMSVNFGSINVGSTSATRTVTVSNNGTANLIIGNLTINNNQFAITSGNISGQTLGPSASANITLTFAPGSTGTHSANLTIPSNDPDENPVNVPLSGSGTTSPQPPPHFTGSSPAQPAPNYFTVDFLGKITQELATNDGRPIKRMEAPSPDDTHLLEIEEYTGATDNTGSIVTLIEIREAVAPELPENTRLVGKALEFKPTGTAFDKSIRLTLGYNVNDLPENVVSVGAAYFSVKDGWIYLQTETTSVAELGKLTAPVDHFTVFAVLAEVAIPVPPEPTPPAPPEPTPPAPPEPLPAPAPALFTLSKLSITTSVTRYYENVSYVVRTGEEALITVDVTNNGGQPGSYTAILIINGEERDRKEVALEPGQTGTVSFTITDNEPGTYDVVIGNLAGDFLSKLWINWWLAAGSTAALILIIWLVWYLIKRKRQQI